MKTHRLISVTISVLFVFLLSTSFISAQTSNTATLALDPDWVIYEANAMVSVDVIVNPGNHSIDGADAVLSYDSSVLTVSSIELTDYFATYPVHTSDSTTITISGLANLNEPLTTSGVMATITFTVSSNPPTQTKLEFITGVDTGSHVAENGTAADVLFTTNSTTFSTSADPGNTPTPQPTLAPGQPTNTPTPTILLPKSGVTAVTTGLSSLLILLVLAGALLLL